MIRYLEDVSPAKAKGGLAEIYRQIRRDFGGVPEPFRLHSASPALLGGFWAVCRESLLAGRAPRQLTELVAVAVSQLNSCPYCVDAHTTMLRAAGEDPPNWPLGVEVRDGIGKPGYDLAVWAAATRSPGSTTLAEPPFDALLAPELVGTAVAFHYINRMVTILAPESPFPGPRALRPLTRRAAPRLFARALRRPKRQGDSLRFVEDAELPADLGWAQASPAVRSAFAGFFTALEREARTAMADDARSVVQTHVEGWSGEDRGLGQTWVRDAVGGLGERDAACARLGLLAALAPHQIHDDVIDAYQLHEPAGSRRLLAVLAWSSAQAARRVGAWCERSP